MPLYTYRLSQWIEKRFNAKGGNVITDIETVARAVITFPSGVEDRYLQAWNRFAVAGSVAAVAANFGRARIRNPTGSNVIAVVEQLTTFSGGAAADSPFVTWGPTVTDLATVVVVSSTRMDPRGNPQPTMIVSTNAQAAGGQPFLQRAQAVGANADFINNSDQQIPLLPGQVIDVQSNTANTQIVVGFMWRERALELSELT